MASKTGSTLLASGLGWLLGGAAGVGGIAGLAGALWVKGQKHWKADEWNKKYQNPWGDKAISFMQDLEARRKAGTLTYEDALKAQSEFESNVGDLQDFQSQFEIKGGDQATVIKQSRATLDPLVKDWRSAIQQHVDALAPVSSTVDETKPPTTQSILSRLGQTVQGQGQAAADQIKKRLAGGGRRATILSTYKTAARPKTLLGY